MFYSAKAFNRNIGSWNTATVLNMRSMFYTAVAFNQPIGSWNTASVSTLPAVRSWMMLHSANPLRPILVLH